MMSTAITAIAFQLFISWNSAHRELPRTDELSSIQEQSSESWSRKIGESFLRRHAGSVTYDSASPNRRWNYEQGLMLEAFHQMWLYTGDKRYFQFIKENIDQHVGSDGSIHTYSFDDFNLDNIGPGRALLTLYEETGDLKYKKAIDTLRKQLRDQPRTKEGGFWHKKIYPHQMWLDGLFMAEPFYAWYALKSNETGDFNDIIDQFVFIARHTRDPGTGLMYHGWDESKQQRWANPTSGCSPNFWGRAIGWYCMAIVDVLDFLPISHPRRDTLIVILKDLSAALEKFRDEKTNLWYQVIDQGNRKGNYLEASASCMFAYAFAKGASKGYLDARYFKRAEATFKGVVENLVTIDEHGFVDLHHTCQGAGLGGQQNRDGSFEYYTSEPQRTNDLKGLGPFLLAAIELEKTQQARTTGQGR